MARGNSWKTRNRSYGEKRNIMEREYKGEPQFKFDNLYISPFTRRKRYDEDGRWQYVALEKDTSPTGIKVMDDYLRYLAAGNSDMQAFVDRYGIKREELAGMVFILTGIKGVRFRQLYQMRIVDDLMRYTNMEPKEVARRSGLGSLNNMYLMLRREYNMCVGERRRFLQKDANVGFYSIN